MPGDKSNVWPLNTESADTSVDVSRHGYSSPGLGVVLAQTKSKKAFLGSLAAKGNTTSSSVATPSAWRFKASDNRAWTAFSAFSTVAQSCSEQCDGFSHGQVNEVKLDSGIESVTG